MVVERRIVTTHNFLPMSFVVFTLLMFIAPFVKTACSICKNPDKEVHFALLTRIRCTVTLTENGSLDSRSEPHRKPGEDTFLAYAEKKGLTRSLDGELLPFTGLQPVTVVKQTPSYKAPLPAQAFPRSLFLQIALKVPSPGLR